MKIVQPEPAVLLMGCLAAISLLATSCSSPSKYDSYKGPTHTFAQETGSAGFGKEVVSETVTNMAKVVAIDRDLRRVELKLATGGIAIFSAGPQVPFFDTMKVGDQVKTVVIEELAVTIAAAGTPLSDSASVAIVRTRNGQPASVVTTRSLTAKVASMNPDLRLVTLRMANGGSKRIRVADSINLGDFKVGEEVNVSLTDSRVISVEEPVVLKP